MFRGKFSEILFPSNSIENDVAKIEMSGWASPIIPVLKKDSTVRIFVEFKVTAN
jgi:hypothetical protein